MRIFTVSLATALLVSSAASSESELDLSEFLNRPDGRVEINIGDLVSEEERTLVLALEVLPIPLMADGTPAADLKGEELVELEIVWDEIGEEEIISKSLYVWFLLNVLSPYSRKLSMSISQGQVPSVLAPILTSQKLVPEQPIPGTDW